MALFSPFHLIDSLFFIVVILINESVHKVVVLHGALILGVTGFVEWCEGFYIT